MAVKKRKKVLSHGRPPISERSERMSSQRSRTIIRTHHRLQKAHAAALKKGDSDLAERIARNIEENGGLKQYQAASKQGQSKDRGGDSSKVLVEWLKEGSVLEPAPTLPEDAKYKCLEVGALSTKNEISKFPKKIEVTRIDLNSQEPGIEKQDFMKRPLPKSADEQFDIISLSLVLNYVPDAAGRGEMLKRITQFLRKEPIDPEGHNSLLPALFLVLPLPCVDNSRYLDEPLLLQIMSNLGFALTNKKNTSKLCHYLFSMTSKGVSTKYRKRKIKDGATMNNFCIVVE